MSLFVFFFFVVLSFSFSYLTQSIEKFSIKQFTTCIYNFMSEDEIMFVRFLHFYYCKTTFLHSLLDIHMFANEVI